MSTWLELLIGIVVIVVLLYVVSALAGVLVWGIIAAVVGAIVLACIRGALRGRAVRRGPGKIARRRHARRTDRALRDLKRTLEPGETDDRR